MDFVRFRTVNWQGLIRTQDVSTKDKHGQNSFTGQALHCAGKRGVRKGDKAGTRLELTSETNMLAVLSSCDFSHDWS